MSASDSHLRETRSEPIMRCIMAQIMVIASVLTVPLAAAGESPVFPGKEWATKPPADAGLHPARLRAFSDFVGGRGVVVRGGSLVHTWGDYKKAGDIASAAKPIYSHFLLMAIEEGKIKSLDDKVAALEPRLSDLNANLNHKDRAITWRHLASQTSCYGVEETPGAAYDYSDPQMALFWDLLFLRTYSAEYGNVDEKVLHQLLTDALQCEDKPTLMAFGVKDRPGRVAISPRDFARFGLLYLRGGEWNGKRLIKSEHVKLATQSPLSNDLPRTKGRKADMIPAQRSIGGGNNQTDHLGSYSFLWWTNGLDRDGKRHWPDAPKDTFGALGHGGKRAMIVLPSLDMVVSWNDSTIDEREKENEALRRLAAAVKAD